MTDAKQFEAFMQAYQNMVYSTAYRLLGNPAEAEDVAQEVFLRAYQRYDELKNSPTTGGWLRTVARNLSLNHLTRYRARWRMFSDMGGETDDDERDFAERIGGPDVEADQHGEADRQQLLESFLERLPVHQRVPLVLYHFEEMSYEDIAKRLEVSLGKVKTDIHRGRDALKKKLLASQAAREEWGPCLAGNGAEE